jgi:hypothetical protein
MHGFRAQNDFDKRLVEAGPMTNDAEVICTWMEPKETRRFTDASVFGEVKTSNGGWWEWRSPRTGAAWPGEYIATPGGLDRLHLVEARLSAEQWIRYRREIQLQIWDAWDGDHPGQLGNLHMTQGELWNKLLHVTAEQKVAALAIALRTSLAQSTDPVAPSTTVSKQDKEGAL